MVNTFIFLSNLLLFARLHIFNLQAVPTAVDEVSSQKRSTFSSVFFSLLPATCSGVGQTVPSSTQDHQFFPSRSHSRSWKFNSFVSKDGQLENGKVNEPETTSNLTSSVTKVNVIDVSERRSAKAAEASEELTSSKSSAVSIPNLMEKSTFVTADLFDFLHSCLPNIVKGCQWVLLYR